jgi:amidase
LLARLAKGQYKAVEVARAFAHRAAIAHQLVNCCLEFLWEAAEKQAQELDDYYAKHRKVMGPLHGLPISLKGISLETFLIQINSVSRVSKHRWGTSDGSDISKQSTRSSPASSANSEQSSTVPSYSSKLMAVKTTVPQSLMCGETINNITGYPPAYPS